MPKRCPTDLIELVYIPSALTDAYLSSSASRGTFTWSNQIWPLSTPFSPIFGPLSKILTPGVSWLLLSRRRTTKTWGPCHLPSTVSCAKTVQICRHKCPFHATNMQSCMCKQGAQKCETSYNVVQAKVSCVQIAHACTKAASKATSALQGLVISKPHTHGGAQSLCYGKSCRASSGRVRFGEQLGVCKQETMLAIHATTYCVPCHAVLRLQSRTWRLCHLVC